MGGTCLFCGQTASSTSNLKRHVQRFHTVESILGGPCSTGLQFKNASADHPNVVVCFQYNNITAVFKKRGYCFDCMTEIKSKAPTPELFATTHVCSVRKAREDKPKEAKSPSSKMTAPIQLIKALKKDFDNKITDLIEITDDADIDVLKTLRAFATKIQSARGAAGSWEDICEDLAGDPRAKVLAERLVIARTEFADQERAFLEDDEEEEPEPVNYRDELICMLASASKWADMATKRDRELSAVKVKVATAESEIESLQRQLEQQKAANEIVVRKNEELRKQLKAAYECEDDVITHS